MNEPTFGDRLLEYLGGRDLPQAWLARKTGVHRTTVNKWIAGENQIPPDKLTQCCTLLNLNALESSELFRLAGYRELGFSHLITWILAGNSLTANELTNCCTRLRLTPAERVKLLTVAGNSSPAQPLPTLLPVTPPAPPKPYSAILYNTPDNLQKPNALLGRQEIVAQIESLLAEGQHILLAGYSGVGKTAIAATLADQQIRDGKGPVLWLEAKYDDLDSLFEGLVAPLGEQDVLSPLSGDAKIHKVKEILTAHRVGLVVLDNFQQAHLFRAVRQAMPAKLPLLITSWQNFINIDHCLTIPALTAQAASDLVAHHAANSALDYSIYQQDADLPELCRQLHYHPLLLLIAGSQLKAFRRKPGYLLTRLDSVLTLEGLPELGEPNRPTMQRALEQMIEVFMSQKQIAPYDRKEKQQSLQTTRLLLRTLGAFPEPSATATFLAAAVDKSVREVEDALDEMVRWNLLTRRQESFYIMHDMIHHYARGLYDKTKRPYPHHLVEAVAQYAQTQANTLEELHLNLPNILYAAMQASDENCLTIIATLALQGYQDNRGHQLSYLKLLDRVLHFLAGRNATSTAQEDTKQRHHLLCKRGNAHFDRGEYEQAAAMYQQALAYAYNPDRQVISLALIGKSLAFHQSMEKAQSYFHQAYKQARKEKNDLVLSFVLEQEAHAAGYNDDHVTARRVAAEQVSINEQLVEDNPTSEIYDRLFRSLTNLGTAERKLAQKSLAEVIALHHRAEAIALKLQNDEMKAHAYWALTEAYHVLGDQEKVTGYLYDAYQLYTQQGKIRDQQIVAQFADQYGYKLLRLNGNLDS